MREQQRKVIRSECQVSKDQKPLTNRLTTQVQGRSTTGKKKKTKSGIWKLKELKAEQCCLLLNNEKLQASYITARKNILRRAQLNPE